MGDSDGVRCCRPPSRVATKKSKTVRQSRKPRRPARAKTIYVSKRKPPKSRAKGKAGRPAGQKVTKVSSSTRRMFQAVMQEVLDEKVKDIKQATLDGIHGGPMFAHHYLKMVRDSTDGPPATTQNLNAHFREDELNKAGRDLQRKLAALIGKDDAAATE